MFFWKSFIFLQIFDNFISFHSEIEDIQQSIPLNVLPTTNEDFDGEITHL